MSMARRLTVFLFSCHRLVQFYIWTHTWRVIVIHRLRLSPKYSVIFLREFYLPPCYNYILFPLLIQYKTCKTPYTSIQHAVKTSRYRWICSQTIIIYSFYQLVNRYCSIFELLLTWHDIIFLTSTYYFISDKSE